LNLDVYKDVFPVLIKGEKGQTLKSGMMSAIEYQWPYKGYALVVEDMFMVVPQHGINITR
jgi:hypothetical protein